MKTRKIIILTFVLAIFTLVGCTKDFVEGFSTDPSELQKAGVNNLLAGAQQYTGWPQGDELGRISEVFMQRGKGTARQATAYNRYQISESNSNTDWGFNLYAGGMKDLDFIIKTGAEQNANHYVGVAKVLMAINLGFLTDIFGDIPYSEAFQGISNLSPKYDTQEQIYTSIIKLCDEAIVSLGKTGLSGLKLSTFDQIYSGDVTKWVKLAHAVKARHLNHLSKLSQYNTGDILIELNASFSSNTDNATVKYENIANKGNPWAQFNVDREGDVAYITGTSFETRLDANNDPRKEEYLKMHKLGSGYLGNYNSPILLYTYHEMKFIEAEVLFRTSGDTTAKPVLEAAIKANMELYGIDEAKITTYLQNLPAVTLEFIMTEKYRALFTQVESWTDWRRTGFPTIETNPYSLSLDSPTIPRRLPYPQSERLYNTNFIDLSSSENRTQRMWWDK